MLGFIRWIIGFFIAILIAFFAVLNRDDVTVILSPLHDVFVLPLYVVTLLSMAVGFILGGVIVWMNLSNVRGVCRKQRKEMKFLEQEISKLKDEKIQMPPPAQELFPALPSK